MEDCGVDWNLAVNYLPALNLLIKNCFLILVCEMVRHHQWYEGMVSIGVLLVVDRLYEQRHIFDSNSVLLSGFLGYVVMLLRSRHGGELGSVAFYGEILISGFWVLYSLYLQSIGDAVSFRMLRVYFVISIVYTCSISWLPAWPPLIPQEQGLRSLLFCMLSVMWVYLIGVYQRRMMKPNESGLHFFVCFSVCLFADKYLVAFFCAGVCALLIAKLCGPSTPGSSKAAPSAPTVLAAVPEPETTTIPQSEEIINLHLLFQEAKERSCKV